MLQLESIALHHGIKVWLDKGISAAKEIFTSLCWERPGYRWEQETRLVRSGVAQRKGFAGSGKRVALRVKTPVPRSTVAPAGSVDDRLTGCVKIFNCVGIENIITAANDRFAEGRWRPGKVEPRGEVFVVGREDVTIRESGTPFINVLPRQPGQGIQASEAEVPHRVITSLVITVEVVA